MQCSSILVILLNVQLQVHWPGKGHSLYPISVSHCITMIYMNRLPASIKIDQAADRDKESTMPGLMHAEDLRMMG